MVQLQKAEHQAIDRLLNVDGLRAICAFAVLFFHFGFRGSFDGLYAPLLADGASDVFKFGQFGVLIFFCISGFVIAFSADKRSPLQFAISRFSRIYPTFVLCLSLVFFVRWLWGDAIFPAQPWQYFANLTMVPQVFGQGFLSGVYWSIIVEVVFYVWVFLLMTLGLFQLHRYTITTAWLVVSAFNEWWLGGEAIRLLAITEFAPFFALGIVLQMKVAAGRWEPRIVLLGLFAFVMAIVVVASEIRPVQSLADLGWPEAISILVFCLGVAVLVLAVESRPIASPTFLMWCGGISYPLYLLHEGVGQIAIVKLHESLKGFLLFGLVTVGMTCLASAVWWFFDRTAVSFTRRSLEKRLLPAN